MPSPVKQLIWHPNCADYGLLDVQVCQDINTEICWNHFLFVPPPSWLVQCWKRALFSRHSHQSHSPPLNICLLSHSAAEVLINLPFSIFSVYFNFVLFHSHLSSHLFCCPPLTNRRCFFSLIEQTLLIGQQVETLHGVRLLMENLLRALILACQDGSIKELPIQQMLPNIANIGLLFQLTIFAFLFAFHFELYFFFIFEFSCPNILLYP